MNRPPNRHFLIRGGLYIKKTLLNRNFTAVEHCFFAYPVFYRTVIIYKVMSLQGGTLKQSGKVKSEE
jgi:hypothetical protein